MACRVLPPSIWSGKKLMAMSDLDTALRTHTDRLIAEFGSTLPPEQIERAVQESAARYKDARVTAFVPIFVYRDARSILSGGHEAAGDVTEDAHG